MFYCVKDIAQLHDVASSEVHVITSIKTIQRRSEGIHEGFNRCVVNVGHMCNVEVKIV